MTSYVDDRERRIRGIAPIWPVGPVLNNTGNSRQVRRQRERDRDKEPTLSDRLNAALGAIEPGMGLFSFSPRSPVLGRRVKRYRAAYLHERMEPHADYSRRYQALFSMPESAPVLQGQAGSANP